MNIRLVWAELFHADERTDGPTWVTELMVAFALPSIFYIKNTEWPKINTTKTHTHTHTFTHAFIHTYMHAYIHTHTRARTYAYAYKITNLSARQSCSQPIVLELGSSSTTRPVTLGFELNSTLRAQQQQLYIDHGLSLQVGLRHLLCKAQINKVVHKYT
jgi:hypothetical protein